MPDAKGLGPFLDRADQAILVRLGKVLGSAPREAGAFMLVSEDMTHGTIGGGQMEFKAIQTARVMLTRGETEQRMDLPLGPGLGQCCGGRVEIVFSRLDDGALAALLQDIDRAKEARPSVYVFGAGHTGQALAECLSLLPVRVVVVDDRADQLARVTDRVTRRETVLQEAEIRHAPAGSCFVIMTHDHALDFMLTAEALARRDARYVGMIGSGSKRAQFRAYLKACRPCLSDKELVCPIGGQGKGDKRPEVISAFVAAEIMACLAASEQAACDGPEIVETC